MGRKKILFETLEDKEEYIEENVFSYTNEDFDMVEFYICPVCKERYEELDDAVSCCKCSQEEFDEDFDE